MSIKLKVLKATIRAANRLRAKNQLKTLMRRENVKASVKADAKHAFKQKPKTGGGAETHPQQLSYGVGAKEHKINQKLASIAARRPAYKGAHHLDESWRSEMTRLFGGIHMSQNPNLVKKSIKLLTKKLKKKKIKKATEGGEVVVHANVDRSLL